MSPDFILALAPGFVESGDAVESRPRGLYKRGDGTEGV
jgi:hypothetical protein